MTTSNFSFYPDVQAFEAFHPYTSYYRQLQHAVVESVQAQPGDLIVELGCATGATSRALAKRYPQSTVLGVDLRPEIIQTAQQETPPDAFPNLFYATSEMTALSAYLPWEGRYPAVVCSLYAFHHIPDPYENKLAFLESLYALPTPTLRVVMGDETTEYEADHPDYPAATQQQWHQVAEEAYRSVFLNRYLEGLNQGLSAEEARTTAVMAGEYVRHIEQTMGETTAHRHEEFPLSHREMHTIWLEAGFSIEVATPINPFLDTLVVALKSPPASPTENPPWLGDEC